MRRKQTIKAWELEIGIKINNLKTFKSGKGSRCTKEAFKKIIENNYITVKCEKGIDFIKNKIEDNEQWRSYIDYSENRRTIRRNKNDYSKSR